MPLRLNLSFGTQLPLEAKHNFRIDLAAGALYSLFNVVVNQFYVPMAIDAGASNLQVGILSAAPAIGLAFSPLWTGWIEQSSPKTFTIIPNLIGRVLILLPALFISPWVFVYTALVYQLLMGIQAPAYAALMTRIYPAAYRGRLMGYTRVAMGLLMIPIAYFVGIWSDKYGSSGPLAAASAAGILSVLVFWWIKESPAPREPSTLRKRLSLKEQWQYARQNRALVIFLIATTLSGFGNILSQPLYQLIQKERLALSFFEIGMARTTYFTCLLVAYFVVGILIDRFKPEKIVVYGIAAFALAPMLYGLSESFPIVLVGSGIQAIGDAIWDIGILAYVFRLAPGREATVFGLHLLLFGIRGTIGPLLSTGLAETVPFSFMLLTASVLGWIGIVVFMFTFSKLKEHNA